MMSFQIVKHVCVDAKFFVFRGPSPKLAKTAPPNVARDIKNSGCIDCACSGFTYFLFAYLVLGRIEDVLADAQLEQQHGFR